jgi:hypothetical protein
MRHILLAAFALLAACDRFPSVAPKADYDPSEAGSVAHALCLLGFTGVPLRSIVTGHHLVDVRINGKPARFVLDTGANATVLHAPFAAELGLGGGVAVPGTAIGLGGALRARQVGIEKFQIGGVPIRRSRIMTADLSQIVNVLGPLSGGQIYGIVGQDVMKEHRAVIDVDGPILYIIPADRDPAPVPAETCRRAKSGGKKS